MVLDIKSYLATQLNEEQLKATLHTDTCSLIIAGAGSGKTRVLTYKIAYLIRGKNIPVNKILAVTFTNKAANEMKERLMKIAEDIRMISDETRKSSDETRKSSDDSIDDFLNTIENNSSVSKSIDLSNNLKWIGTFHSIFLKILKEDIEKLEKNYNKNFGIFDTNESVLVIKDVLKKLNLQEVFKYQEAKNFISTQKNNGIEPSTFAKNANSDYDQSMVKVYTEYQKELEKSNGLDFDDLLLIPYLLFKKKPEILQKWVNKFQYILVDEAQDTNRIQFELMRMLSGEKGNITFIGDDFQSIYGRRGALMENFLNVKKYWPDMQMFKLQINYRSRPHIVKAGNEIIKNNLNQYKKNIVAHREGDDKITIFSHGNETDEAANIVDMIKKMKEGGKLKNWSQVAILYRTNAQSSPFEQLFIQEGIPYKVWGAFKFFDRKEIKDVLSYLKYLVNPQDSVSLKRILNIPNRKIGKTTLDSIQEYGAINDLSLSETLVAIKNETCPIRLTPGAKTGLNDFFAVINSLKEKLSGMTPAEVIENLDKKIKYRDHLVKEEGGEFQADEKYENIGQLINMAGKYSVNSRELDQRISDNNKDYNSQGLNQNSQEFAGEELLKSFLEEVTLLTDISENEKGEIEAVKLMTVHSSKGLEFPMVFVVGLEDNIFPLSNSMMETNLLEEERRLMYVAITRAKDVLFLSHAHSRMTWGQTKMNPPSRFLDEIPADLIKKFDLSGGADLETRSKINESDIVKHKLFGTGYVLEVWNKFAIIRFHNAKFGTKKVECRFLEIV
ncbi:MAG: UvrD-helicase domain-containing protein [Candidatus Absconditabacterales bacterium]